MFLVSYNVSTGASAGIGAACAKEFAKEGSHLVSVDENG
jgi:NADP-dependent 3-hydroxy acid dehydrogenase YdfG